MIRFFQWLVESPWSQALARAEWLFPIIQSVHFIGFAFLIGTIAIVDLRLLGLGMRRQNAAELAADLDPFKWAGLVMMLITGFIMFSSSATAYHYNPSFRFKMTCLTLALLFHFTLRRWVLRSETPALSAKLAGATSLLLWTAVVAGGRMIAFV
jgi:hypothetical protein